MLHTFPVRLVYRHHAALDDDGKAIAAKATSQTTCNGFEGESLRLCASCRDEYSDAHEMVDLTNNKMCVDCQKKKDPLIDAVVNKCWKTCSRIKLVSI